ncbi:hypothetical protein ACFDR9_003643 [Janthinobacterium sp. CG_23.3]|uniref:hypothetical protein n=1 Tax=Janthinobacterium sp. CG_23.3 TaxID=3349634 RepID=UPI0038D51841
MTITTSNSSSVKPPAPLLATPLRVLGNTVRPSRGKSVDKEVLGVGDASRPGQEFTLAKSPLTYLASGPGYRSTLRVYVNGVEWREMASFYGSGPRNDLIRISFPNWCEHCSAK